METRIFLQKGVRRYEQTIEICFKINQDFINKRNLGGGGEILRVFLSFTCELSFVTEKQTNAELVLTSL